MPAPQPIAPRLVVADGTAVRCRRDLAPLGWGAAFLALSGLLQLLTPVPWDADTAYHVAVGRLIARHGILRAFPWTPFSYLSDRYGDKELLFHLLFAPLAGLSWIAAAKIVGAVLGAVILLALYLVLRAEGVTSPGLITLLPLAASGAFALRFALVRPHLLSITLALVAAWAAARERPRLLAGVSFLYPWCYVAWATPVLLAAIAAVARVAGRRPPRWRLVAIAAIACAAGVAAHPNSGNLVRLAWVQLVEVMLRTAWGGRPNFDLGPEFAPLEPADALRYLLLPALLAAAAAVVAWRRRLLDPASLAFALAALAYGLLTARTQRFVEYAVPFAVLAAAVGMRDLLRPWPWARHAPVAVLAAAFLFTVAFGARPVLALATRGDDLPPPAAEFLRTRIPEGAQVFTCEWGLTGELLLALPERRFLVALDPVFLWMRDPELYRIWWTVPREGPPDAAALVRTRFGARYVLCGADLRWAPLFGRLRADRTVRPLLESPLWFLYDLGDGRDASFDSGAR